MKMQIIIVMQKKRMTLLRKSHINTLSCSKDKLSRPFCQTRVVICSYGLIPTLINKSKKIKPGTFKCILVDESHMLKCKNSQRTKAMLPVLKAAPRCVLLSGTPALARPKELWPQLSVLGDWWVDENSFIEKYVRPAARARSDDGDDGTGEGNSASWAELHTLLTSTVMIRRVKADMLKSLPPKLRELAYITLQDEGLKYRFNKYMALLREGSGTLGKLARTHHVENAQKGSSFHSVSDGDHSITVAQALHKIDLEADEQHRIGIDQIQKSLIGSTHLGEESTELRLQSMEAALVQKINDHRKKRKIELKNGNGFFDGKKIIESSFLDNESPLEGKEEMTRKSVLNELYKMTGAAKVPAIIQKLKQWLNDPTKGKLCIFAHHLSVLDDIQSGADLSNAPGSKTKFIRIDGATMPKVRQESIVSFQNDPTVRVAVLGITAAGVAVTLTASSNIWFAELFWTPAIMIQAEDRCHRIGQQSNVRCVYFQTRDTLDEILWRLIEKKFRALGEFVEGKEKQKIVVHKTYEWDQLGNGEVDNEIDDEDGELEQSSQVSKKRQRSESFADLVDTDDIQHDIEELCREEEEMLKDANNKGDDDVAENVSDTGSKSPSAPSDSKKQKEQIKEVAGDQVGETSLGPPLLILKDVINYCIKAKSYKVSFNPLMKLPNLRVYKMHFLGPSYGLYLSYYQGRIIVRKKHPKREEEYGVDVKPDVGSIVLAINGYSLPQKMTFQLILGFMKKLIQKQHPVELTIGEDEEFSTFFIEVALPTLQEQTMKQEKASNNRPTN